MDSRDMAANPPPNLPVDRPLDPSVRPLAISTRAEFHAAVGWALQAALARQARRLLWVDPDFSTWPLGQPELLSALQAWLRLPQRRLVLLARHYHDVPLRHPRFVAWRRDWAHAIDAWVAPAETPALPCVLVDDGPVLLQLFEGPQLRGRASLDAREARRWREEFDAVLQQSEPGFPVQTLGL